MTENDMVSIALNRLADRKAVAAIGVPFMSRCIDMVLVMPQDCVWAVEFKLHDWRRAIAQAKDHLLGADYAWVCMPVLAPSASMLRALDETGVGFLRFRPEGDWPFEQLVAPKRSAFIWPPARRQLLEQTAETHWRGALCPTR